MVRRPTLVRRHDADAAPPSEGRIRALKLVAATSFLAGLVVLPNPPGVLGHPGQEDAEKVLRELDSKIRRATTLKVRYLRRTYETADLGPDGTPARSKPFDSGSLLLKEGNLVYFVRREPVNPPGGLDKEFVTACDGKRFISLMRDAGEVLSEAAGDTPAGLEAQVAAGMTRGGIHAVTLLVPDASAPRGEKDAFWELPASAGVALADGGAGSRRLTYTLGKGPASPRVTLWFESKTLTVLRIAREDPGRLNLLEIYEEFALNEPLADAWFALPPGQKEGGGLDLEVGDFLDLKKAVKLREVWIEDRDLRADLLQPVTKDGNKHFKVHVRLSAEVAGSENALQSLTDGLDPLRVHRAPRK